jgi:hypothetical protein
MSSIKQRTLAILNSSVGEIMTRSIEPINPLPPPIFSELPLPQLKVKLVASEQRALTLGVKAIAFGDDHDLPL